MRVKGQPFSLRAAVLSRRHIGDARRYVPNTCTFSDRLRVVHVGNQKAAHSTIFATLVAASVRSVDAMDEISTEDLWAGRAQDAMGDMVRLLPSSPDFLRVWQDYVWITSVRNPFTRTLSAWRHLVAAPHGRLLTDDQWRARVEPYSHDYSSFILGIARGDRALVNEDPVWPAHWLPQTLLLNDGMRERINLVLPFESLHDEDFIGTLPPYLRNLVTVDDHATGTGMAFDDHLTDEALDAFIRTYRSGFAYLGYSTDPSRVAEPPALAGF